MTHRLWRVALVPVVTLSLGLALAAVLAAGAPQAAHAQGGTGIVRVAKTGSGDSPGCGGPATPCATIQYAIGEATEGDEVRVAQGTYTGTQAIVATSLYGPYTYTQVALITKTLTLRGGYTTADWSTSVPTQNVTTIDAEGYGRGVSIVGDGAQTVTVEGFTITGGDYTGLGNPDGEGNRGCQGSGSDCAGGLLARDVTVIVRRAVISNNVSSQSTRSSDGGGMYLWGARAGSRIEDTTVISNASLGTNSNGGGAHVVAEEIVVVGTSFIGNYAEDSAGGLHLDVWNGSGLVEGCEFTGNRTGFYDNGWGGGLRIVGSALVRGSTFTSNKADDGGAVYLYARPDRPAVLDANVIVSNTAVQGGGIILNGARPYELTNNLIARNSASWFGGAAYVRGGSQSLWIHNTIAENDRGSRKEGLMIQGDGTAATLTNNIIVTQSVAILADENAQVMANHTLFYGNGEDSRMQDGGTIVSTNEITGSAPMFVDPDAWDYHLQAGSPAIDAGTETDVKRDIDGDARPDNCAYDIGADEFVSGAKCWDVYLPLVVR